MSKNMMFSTYLPNLTEQTYGIIQSIYLFVCSWKTTITPFKQWFLLNAICFNIDKLHFAHRVYFSHDKQ
jgi:hypothetical protein